MGRGGGGATFCHPYSLVHQLCVGPHYIAHNYTQTIGFHLQSIICVYSLHQILKEE